MPDATRDPAPHQPIRLADYQPPHFLIDSVDLVFDLGEEKTSVKARLAMRRNPASRESQAPLKLAGRELELVSLALNGEKLGANRYAQDAEALTVASVPDDFTLDIETRIEPQNNTVLSGLYKSGGNFCTQCEPEGFRRITYFLDRPDVMARFTTTIVADKAQYPVLLSNGNPTDQGDSRAAGIVRSGSIHSRSPLSLRARRRRSRCLPRQLHDQRRQTVTLASGPRADHEDKCDHAMRR